MINWHKPIIGAALRISYGPVFRNLKFLKSIEYKSQEELKALQNEKLCQLLKHAYQNVPYYNKILSQAGLIKNKRVGMENFHKLPILTKDIIRREEKRLYCADYRKRGWSSNTSGNSTGTL